MAVLSGNKCFTRANIHYANVIVTEPDFNSRYFNFADGTADFSCFVRGEAIPDNDNASLIVAAYDSNYRLVHTEIYDLDIEGDVLIYGRFETKEVPAYYKAFLWDGLYSMQPLCDAIGYNPITQ